MDTPNSSFHETIFPGKEVIRRLNPYFRFCLFTIEKPQILHDIGEPDAGNLLPQFFKKLLSPKRKGAPEKNQIRKNHGGNIGQRKGKVFDVFPSHFLVFPSFPVFIFQNPL